MIPSRYRGIEKTRKEVNEVLDKIRAEISKLLDSPNVNSAWYRLAIKDCLKVIDKAESEDEDA